MGKSTIPAKERMQELKAESLTLVAGDTAVSSEAVIGSVPVNLTPLMIAESVARDSLRSALSARGLYALRLASRTIKGSLLASRLFDAGGDIEQELFLSVEPAVVNGQVAVLRQFGPGWSSLENYDGVEPIGLRFRVTRYVKESDSAFEFAFGVARRIVGRGVVQTHVFTGVCFGEWGEFWKLAPAGSAKTHERVAVSALVNEMAQGESSVLSRLLDRLNQAALSPLDKRGNPSIAMFDHEQSTITRGESGQRIETLAGRFFAGRAIANGKRYEFEFESAAEAESALSAYLKHGYLRAGNVLLVNASDNGLFAVPVAGKLESDMVIVSSYGKRAVAHRDNNTSVNGKVRPVVNGHATKPLQLSTFNNRLIVVTL